MRKYIAHATAVGAVLYVVGCATIAGPVQSRLYNLRDGSVIILTNERSTSRGRITGIGPDGERFLGEYTFHTGDTFVNSSLGSGVVTPGNLYGTGVIRGDKGTVIEEEFYASRTTGHGGGKAKDNKGNQYRIQF